MKKYFVTIAFIALIASCGTGTGSTTTTDSSTTTTITTPAAKDITTDPNYAPGLALVAKNDCLTCHQVADKVIGPSYQSVANKYAGVDTAITYLAHKVIKGGSGVWGTVAMTPHDSLPEADAEQMVKYILLLKTK